MTAREQVFEEDKEEIKKLWSLRTRKLYQIYLLVRDTVPPFSKVLDENQKSSLTGLCNEVEVMQARLETLLHYNTGFYDKPAEVLEFLQKADMEGAKIVVP